VTAILPDEIFGVADNPLIVDLLISDLICMASIRAPGASIRVFCDGSLLPKRLRKALRTLAIHHARCIRVLGSARPMNHKLLDEFKQLIIAMWKFRGHKAINMLWGAQLGMRLKKDNNMSMRKATLLELNCVEIGSHITQDTLLNISNKRLKLSMKNANHQVRAIWGSLVIKKCTLNFWPVRIGSHGDEKISSSIIAINGQCILTMLLHIASAARKARRQNESFAQLIPAGINIGSHSICQTLINLNTQLSLIHPDVVKAALLSNSPCLTYKLLKELASKKEMIRLNISGANMKAIAKEFSHSDIFLLRFRTFLSLLIGQARIPTKLASRKKENIVQRGIKRVKVRNVLKRRAMLAIKDDILRASRLITITWQNDCNLIY
jgi:hypothetical protein